MEAFHGKSINYGILARAIVLGLVALCGAASPLLAQETVAGKFKLTGDTRLGKRLLPAGAYTFSVEPMGAFMSVNSIQGASHPVQVIVRSATSPGSVAIILAMASRSAHTLDSSKLVLTPVNNGMAMHSMYLEEPGLVLDFDWWSPKDKTELPDQAARPEPASASSAN